MSPLRRMAKRLIRIPSAVIMRSCYSSLLVVLAGVAGAAAFAPVGYFLLAPLAVGWLIYRWQDASPAEAFRLGWLFGVGLFGAGVSWVYISCHQYGGLSVVASVLLAALLVVYLALYPALVGYLYRRYWAAVPAAMRLLLLPLLWVLLEAVREHLFSGFGWLALGYSQSDGPLAALAPLGGQPLVTWAVVVSGAALVLLVRGPGWRGRSAAAGLLIAVWAGGWGAGQISWTQAAGESLEVALIQGNVPQRLKWSPEMQRTALQRYLVLSEPHSDVALLLWPETAIPAFADQLIPDLLEPYSRAWQLGKGPLLLSGLLWRDEGSDRYYNAVVAAAPGWPRFLKHHLVPFGEYVPLDRVLGRLLQLFDLPYPAFSAGAVEQSPLQVDGYEIGVSICYEDAFGEELRRRLPATGFLVNVSNDGWFGRSAAPYQHLQMARMRARESGRYLLRATNSGVSAIVGPTGAVKASAPLDTTTVLVGEVVPYTGLTPYMRYGTLPWYCGALLLLVIARLRWRSAVS